MDRSNPYEAAFEAYLQWHRLCYVAVDETRRCTLGAGSVKNLDFVVYGEGGARLLIDVKGRRYPAGPPDNPRRVWECWAPREDVDGLLHWQERFGPGYRALLLFVYRLAPDGPLPDVPADLWTWRGQRFLFRGVPVGEYRDHMRVRSPKWGTVSLPGAAFRTLARPFHHFLHETLPEDVEEAPF